MKKNRVTSRQVAKHAGVSQTTVSFVINNVEKASVSPKTRQRVLQAAEELGYVPNVAAQSLIRGHSNQIGLVIIQPHNQIFMDAYVPNILTGLSRVTRNNGYRILLEIIESSDDLNTLRTLAQGKAVAGLIILGGNLIGLQDFVSQLANFPVVLLNKIGGSQMPSVSVDSQQGVQEAVKHLIKLGHTRIACIPYADPAIAYSVGKRLGAYKNALESSGITPDDSLIIHGEYDPETGQQAMHQLLGLPTPPTALFAMNDNMAFGAMAAIRECGLSIPEDMAVVGFDDERLSAFTYPPLTTVKMPDIQQGEHAAQLLLDLIHEQKPDQTHIQLAPQLVIRQSCGAYL